MALHSHDEDNERFFPSNLIQRGTVFARLPQNVNLREDITNYGLDNLYPQRMQEISLRSPTTLSAMGVWRDFIKGNGFEQNGDVVVNRWGETLNDVLRFVAGSKSEWDAYGLHFNVNPLGLITEILPVNYEFIRYGLPNEMGRHSDVKVSNNWERNTQKTINNKVVIQTFALWDMRESTMESMTEDIEKFEGFVHYKVQRRDKYPFSTFDSVADSVQSEGEIQTFELSNIQNSFLGASIFKLPSEIESEAERRQIKKDLYGLTGPSNANSVMIVEDIPENFNLIEQIPANNSDTLFVSTNQSTRDRIVMNYKTPAPLLGIQPTGGVFNQEDQVNSYLAMNTKTRDARLEVVEDFEKFLQFWAGGPLEVGGIIESSFDVLENGEVQETQE